MRTSYVGARIPHPSGVPTVVTPVVTARLYSKYIDPTNPFPAGSDLFYQWENLSDPELGSFGEPYTYLRLDIRNTGAPGTFSVDMINWGKLPGTQQPWSPIWWETTEIEGDVTNVHIDGWNYDLDLVSADQYPELNGASDSPYLPEVLSADVIDGVRATFTLGTDARVTVHWFNRFLEYSGASLYHDILSQTNTFNVRIDGVVTEVVPLVSGYV